MSRRPRRQNEPRDITAIAGEIMDKAPSLTCDHYVLIAVRRSGDDEFTYDYDVITDNPLAAPEIIATAQMVVEARLAGGLTMNNNDDDDEPV